MPRLIFTQQLARFLPVPAVETDALTLRAALASAFAGNPLLRAYVLDDQDHLREHVVVFVDGRRVSDRSGLNEALRPDSTVYILQALSGG